MVSDAAQTTARQAVPDNAPIERKLPKQAMVDSIDPNPFQPRLRSFEHDDSLGDLVADMRQFGFRGTLEVRPVNDGRGRLQLVSGHRRLEAAKRAGLKTISVQQVYFTDEQMEQSALRENLLREDLTPWEEAVALQKLRDRGMTYHQIKDFVGRSVGWVQARLALLKTEGALREAAMTEPDMLTVINTLLLLEPHEREPLFERVREGELNVEDLRSLVRAKRDGLRRLEASILPEGGRKIDVSLQQQAVQAAQRAQADPVAPVDDVVVEEKVDPVWEQARRAALAAQATALPLELVRENPADNPEGQQVGLTVDNGVATWDDVDVQPTDAATARNIAAGLALGPIPTTQEPTRPLVLNDETHWQSPQSTMTEEERREAANLEFVRVLEGIRDNMRRNIEKTHPGLATPELRRRVRAVKKDINDILVVMS